MALSSHKRLLPRNIDGLFVIVLFSWFVGFMLVFLSEFSSPEFFDKYRLDFSKFYSMGELIVSPDRTRLYDTRVQYEWLGKNCKLPALGAKDTTLMFAICSEQPPPFFLLFSPFAILPQRTAFVVAMLLFGALTCFAIVLLNKCRQNKFTRVQLLTVFLGAFGSGPAVAGILQGHTNWLITGLAGLFAANYLRNNQLLAGFFLACFVIKPQYGVFLMIPPLLERKWRIIGFATLFIAMFLGLSALIAGPQCVLEYPSVLVRSDMTLGQHTDPLSLMVCTQPHRMTTLRGFLTTLFPQKLAMQLATIFLLVALAGLSLMWMKITPKANNRNWAMALTVMASIVFGLHSFFYDCSIFVVAAALTLPNLSLISAFKQNTVSVKIWMIGMLMYPLLTSVVYLAPCTDEVKTRVLFIYSAVLFAAGIKKYLSTTSPSDQTE